MAREKKDGRNKTFKLKTEIADALEAHAEETGLSLTVIVEKALKEYLGVNNKKSK